GEIELISEEPQEGKTDLEVEIKDEKVGFYLRVNKFLEREFKKFYRKANEVKKVLETQKEKYLAHLAEIGFKDYFTDQARWLFSDQKDLKTIALKMASGEIDLDDYTEGRSKQIEMALTGGKKFDELEQTGVDRLPKSRGKRLSRIERSTLESLESQEEIVNRLSQEYFGSLPKTTQVELADIIKAVQENEFYRQVVKAQKETFSADKLYDNCDHCLEAGSLAPFKRGGDFSPSTSLISPSGAVAAQLVSNQNAEKISQFIYTKPERDNFIFPFDMREDITGPFFTNFQPEMLAILELKGKGSCTETITSKISKKAISKLLWNLSTLGVDIDKNSTASYKGVDFLKDELFHPPKDKQKKRIEDSKRLFPFNGAKPKLAPEDLSDRLDLSSPINTAQQGQTLNELTLLKTDRLYDGFASTDKIYKELGRYAEELQGLLSDAEIKEAETKWEKRWEPIFDLLIEKDGDRYNLYPQGFQEAKDVEEDDEPEITLTKGEKTQIGNLTVLIKDGYLQLGTTKYELIPHPRWENYYGLDINPESLGILQAYCEEVPVRIQIETGKENYEKN
ncbi:35348_t:CDS:10, partial [Racocetra persica]